MAELGLTAWDWFVLATVVLSIGLGFIRGLVRTIFALAAWVVSLLGVPVAMHWLVPVLPPELPYALLVVVIFLTLFIGVRMLGSLAFRALRGIGLGGADRLLGGALGAVRAAVIILLKFYLPNHLELYLLLNLLVKGGYKVEVASPAESIVVPFIV